MSENSYSTGTSSSESRIGGIGINFPHAFGYNPYSFGYNPYSFGLYPEASERLGEHNYSPVLSMTRIDNAVINFQLTDAQPSGTAPPISRGDTHMRRHNSSYIIKKKLKIYKIVDNKEEQDIDCCTICYENYTTAY